jgi:hypothetical protein
MAVRTLPEADDLRNAFVYDAESGEFRKRGHDEAITAETPQGYVRVQFAGGTWPAHRLIWKMQTGEEPSILDHINGVRNDNRWVNLRSVSDRENSQNRAISTLNTSGVTGVHWHKVNKKWTARIKIKGRWLHIGGFHDFDEAVNARKAAERKYGFHPNHGKRTVSAS